MEKSKRFFVSNQRNQPLELHLPGGVAVLAPYEGKEIHESDVKNAQLQAFLKQRVVVIRQAEEPPIQAAETVKTDAEQGSSAVSPAEKSEGVKRRGTKKEG